MEIPCSPKKSVKDEYPLSDEILEALTIRGYIVEGRATYESKNTKKGDIVFYSRQLPESLNLSCTYITDVSCLARSPIKSLDLGYCTTVRDISPLAEIVSLEKLTLLDCTGIVDVSALGELPSLRYLNLTGCTGIKDVVVLARIKSLNSLYLKGCTGITNVSMLSAIPHLDLRECTSIRDFSYVPYSIK